MKTKTKRQPKLNPAIHPTPVLYFDKYQIQHWPKNLKVLHEQMEALRIRVKEATGYTWDNCHYFITDVYGKPAISISFYSDGVNLWSAVTGTSLGNLETLDHKLIETFVEEIQDGRDRCCQCEKWFSKPLKRYSYAGAVCPGCYNPKVHLTPDTSGD